MAPKSSPKQNVNNRLEVASTIALNRPPNSSNSPNTSPGPAPVVAVQATLEKPILRAHAPTFPVQNSSAKSYTPPTAPNNALNNTNNAPKPFKEVGKPVSPNPIPVKEVTRPNFPNQSAPNTHSPTQSPNSQSPKSLFPNQAAPNSLSPNSQSLPKVLNQTKAPLTKSLSQSALPSQASTLR